MLDKNSNTSSGWTKFCLSLLDICEIGFREVLDRRTAAQIVMH